MATQVSRIALKTEEIVGINAPREHQRCIRNLVYNLTNHLLHLPYDVLPESSLDADDRLSKCPDVLVENSGDGSIPLLIEVTGKGGVKRDKKKIAEIFLENQEQLYGLQEGFVYDYDSDKWYRITADADEESSYSHSLRLDLKSFIALER